MASYVTFTLSQKIARLGELEQRQALGPVQSSRQGGGVQTDFDTKNINLEREIQKLIDAILADPGFDSDNPLWDALQGSRRIGQTTPVFY